MLVGDLIARFEDEGVAAEALLSLDDLALVARVTRAAAESELTTGEFVVRSVDRFVAQASDDDWLKIVGQMTNSEQPGLVFVHRILARAVTDPSPAA